VSVVFFKKFPPFPKDGRRARANVMAAATRLGAGSLFQEAGGLGRLKRGHSAVPVRSVVSLTKQKEGEGSWGAGAAVNFHDSGCVVHFLCPPSWCELFSPCEAGAKRLRREGKVLRE
jgi:hypothetical protein